MGELANMMAGSICTAVSNKGFSLDITPPTVMVGQTKLSGFQQACCVPISITDAGVLRVIVMIEDAN
ncbi:chemotaxis protein CheC [Alicyclobacillus dauci]|uniref:Chemotaxis protein CheC n=1 Tax=Alicyclobacillus dauci TaxID=1475485 RepID=A0ABY6Z8X4_9BACL|nr:chemotaxis protein CheC [Alicyclobacillus dauci]